MKIFIMQTVRRSTRERRAMREPDSVYFEELQMSIMTLGFELSAAEKELLLQSDLEGSCVCKRSRTKKKFRGGDSRLQTHKQTNRAGLTDKIKRPSKAEVEILVNALDSLEEEHTYKQRINEHGNVVKSYSKLKALNHADLNTEDSSSQASSPKHSSGSRDGIEPVLHEQFNLYV